METSALVVGSFETNCWLLSNGDGHAIVIDPGDEAQRILRELDRRELQVSAYVLTHGHVDHISALSALYARRPAPIVMHADDAAWAFTRMNELPPFYDAPATAGPVTPLPPDGDTYVVDGMACRVLSTPGHTPGSVCLYFEDAGLLFSGDTLFAGSVGRTDLKGGSPRQLQQSLKKLGVLPDGVRVCPGHGPASTIGREKKTNMFMQAASP
jgi:glyoxylase-like metal-dependent hydrolase (beta-lactamase superfamily II)